MDQSPVWLWWSRNNHAGSLVKTLKRRKQKVMGVSVVFEEAGGEEYLTLN